MKNPTFFKNQWFAILMLYCTTCEPSPTKKNARRRRNFWKCWFLLAVSINYSFLKKNIPSKFQQMLKKFPYLFFENLKKKNPSKNHKNRKFQKKYRWKKVETQKWFPWLVIFPTFTNRTICISTQKKWCFPFAGGL